MAKKHVHPPDELEKTDRLPILDPAMFDSQTEFEDGAVRMESTAVLPANSFAAPVASPEFARPSALDLPSLAESLRSVEERIARQSTEFETLNRSYERLRDSESAASARANALAEDLAAARAALESEQARSREIDKTLAEKLISSETARARIEEALRESERYQSESRTLREAMAARDAMIAQVLHSLGERDAQLSALQQEHARLGPVLEATSQSGSQLEMALQAARGQTAAVASELKATQDTVALLKAQLKRSEGQVSSTLSELGSAKVQASTHLELLQTREWRSGFDLNLFREMDANVGAAHSSRSALESERDRLLAQHSSDLERAEEARGKLATELATAEAEVARLNTELAARDRALTDARAANSGDAKRVSELLAAAEQRRVEQDAHLAKLQVEHKTEVTELAADFNSRMARTQAEQGAKILELQSQAESREQEMAVLMAHLQEAKRPLQVIEAEDRRLREELAAKTAGFDALTEEHEKVRSALERTRGALEEREFLIRRLERSESNNANVLGRIQTSIERLGSISPSATATGVSGATHGGGTTAAPDWSAELIRVDGERPTTHVLSRRTRIGRAQGCEVQIDSTSVSRHHAMVLVGAHDCIIEDLNSTNGVLVNGRKVARQLLHDGDAVTIGDIQFRYSARSTVHTSEPRPSLPPPSGF
ncbi:MAG: FHA domain-containing protein [Pseudomonadota bacterium]|nr:FHA domain-containing protein [Pseudomonadota bacterium]